METKQPGQQKTGTDNNQEVPMINSSQDSVKAIKEDKLKKLGFLIIFFPEIEDARVNRQSTDAKYVNWQQVIIGNEV